MPAKAIEKLARLALTTSRETHPKKHLSTSSRQALAVTPRPKLRSVSDANHGALKTGLGERNCELLS